MTTSLPVIRIRPTDSGWHGVCNLCAWSMSHTYRPPIDEAGIEHRRRCRRKD